MALVGESHACIACVGRIHGDPTDIRAGSGACGRVLEGDRGLVCTGGSSGELARCRGRSGVMEEDSWVIGDPHLANDAFDGLGFNRGEAFRRASLSWPKEPLGHPDRPLSLSFKNELMWLFRIVMRLSFEYFQNVRNGNW